MSMFRTAIGVTTASCFVCGQGTTVQFHSPRKGKSEQDLLCQWRKQWSMSLCHVLQLSDSFQSIFNEASFCFNCQEAVCRAEFTVNAISRLQNEIGVIRKELKGNFQSHYENLMQGRTEVDTTGNEYKRMEDIINQIAVKLEPVEETVVHFLDLDNLADRDIVIPGMDPHENEFPTLEILDPLENLHDSLENNILLSDEDDSVVLPIPSISKLTSMRQRQNLVRRSGRSINSRVNLMETYGSSSDSGNDFEEHEDPDFSGTEMAEADKEIAGSKSMKPKSSRRVRLKCNFEKCLGKIFSFGRTSDMRMHLTEVHGGQSTETLYHCPQCPLRFNRLKVLEQHTTTCHNAEHQKPNCPRCGKELSSWRYLHRHQCVAKEKSGGQTLVANVGECSSRLVSPPFKWVPLKCSICLKEFDLDWKLKDHEILHVPETLHACVLCSQQNLNSAAQLRRHVQSAHDKMKYWCNMEPCLSSCVAFSRLREMRSHYTSEHSKEGDQRIYHCTKCSAKFKESSYLLKHSKTHNPLKTHLCVICGKMFRTKVVLKQHERSFHTELQMKPKCSICTKSFEGVAEVEEHEKLHSKETPFRCVVCDKTLLSTMELQRHVVACHEFLEFECPAEGCEAKFTSKHNLYYHQRRSHDPKRYACPHCPARFSYSVGLKTHLFCHSEERSHSCPTTGCERTFTSKAHLEKHIRIVHSENHFACRICGKRFALRSLLAGHEVYHGTARPFMCDICSATFKTKQTLRSHMKSHTKTSGGNRKLPKPGKARIRQIQT